MTAEIIPFPEPRPWSKYTYDAESRASAERLFGLCLEFREELGGVGCPPATPVEAAERDTVKLLQASEELAARLLAKGVPPPAS